MLRGSHGDVAGAESDASSVERSTSEHGNCPWSARYHAASVVTGLGTPSADQPGVGRSRRSSRRSHDLPWRPGEPVTGRRAAVVSRSIEKRLEAVMPKDAPPNGDALPDDDTTDDVPVGPRRRVSEMQAKLHRWAVADPGRRFDDLFNLVHDPATLIVAWDRVSSNRGAQYRRFGRVDCHPDRSRGRGHAVPGRPPRSGQERGVPT